MSAALAILSVDHINIYSFYVRCIGNIVCRSYKYLLIFMSAALSIWSVGCINTYSSFMSTALAILSVGHINIHSFFTSTVLRLHKYLLSGLSGVSIVITVCH